MAGSRKSSKSKLKRQSSKDAQEEAPEEPEIDMIDVRAVGPDGTELEIEVERNANTAEIQSLVGRDLFMLFTEHELIDISIGGCKPLATTAQPFAGLAEPDGGFVIQYRVIGRIPRLLKKARLKSLTKTTRFQRTPLHIVVGKKDLKTCRELLQDSGFPSALVNARDVFGDTALMLASIMGEDEIVRLLLQHNAEIEHKNPMGRSALMLAAEMGHEEVAQLLLEHGANYKVDTSYNWKKQLPLKTSVYSCADVNNRQEIIELLSDHEADLADKADAEAEKARAEAEADEWGNRSLSKSMPTA